RAFVAQGLVNHRVYQAAVLAYLAPQRRPVYEEVHHIAQEMGGGFRARDEQLHAKAHDFPVLERLAVDLRFHERGDEVLRAARGPSAQSTPSWLGHSAPGPPARWSYRQWSYRSSV